MKKPSLLLGLAAAWLILCLLLAGCGQPGQEGSPSCGEGGSSRLETVNPSLAEPEDRSSSADSNSLEDVTQQPEPSSEPLEDTTHASQEATSEMTFYLHVNGSTFSAKLADTVGAQALADLLESGPLTVSLRDYGGFEKVGSLGQSLPTSDSPTTTQAGDIVLYLGNQIVMFYGSNSWSYTRLARVEDLTGWEEALGSGSVSVTLSLEE